MNQSELFDLIVEKSNQIAALDGTLSLAMQDIKTLKDDVSQSDVEVNYLQHDVNNVVHSQSSLVERINMLEKKVDVLCNNFSFLFTQLDEQDI